MVTCTLLFISCNSIRTESDHPTAAHLLAAYTLILGLDIMPPAEAIVQMCPSLRCTMSGSICRATYMGAMAFTIIVRFISSSVHWSKVLLLVMMPALFISMSTSPTSFFTLSYCSATISCLDTSTRYPCTVPFLPSSFTVSSMLSWFMSQMTRAFAPFSRAISPISRPIPEAPPVISTILPLIFDIFLFTLSVFY